MSTGPLGLSNALFGTLVGIAGGLVIVLVVFRDDVAALARGCWLWWRIRVAARTGKVVMVQPGRYVMPHGSRFTVTTTCELDQVKLSRKVAPKPPRRGRGRARLRRLK